MNKYDLIEILLVEDNFQQAELTLLAIKRSKLTEAVHWVSDGEEAIDFLFAQGKYADRDVMMQPKIILLDITLPKFDGLRVLNKIRSNPYTSGINVIILSSSSADQDIFESIKGGVAKYLVKPVEFDEFVKQIYEELRFYWKLF